MAKFVAKCDTTYNFKFYLKGQTIEAGDLLDDNPNFERADGSTKAATTASSNKNAKETKKAEEMAARMRAKELKIANWSTKSIDVLMAEIAEAETKAAAPANVSSAESKADSAKE